MSAKKKRKERGKGLPNWALAALAGLLVLGLVWKLRRPSSPAPMSAHVSPGPEAAVISNNEFKQNRKQEQARSLLLAQERAADLRPLPVSISDGMIKLDVTSRLFVRRCIASDFDIMERDLKLTGRKEPGFILSLENLDPASRTPPQQLDLTLEQIRSNIHHIFQIPQSPRRSTWGIFICTKNSGSCTEQKKLSLADIARQQGAALNQPTEAARYPKEPKVFFFHFLVAYQDRLLLLDPLQSLDSSFQRLEKALALAGGEPVSPSLMNAVKNDLRAIGSMPAIIRPGGLEIQMPHQGKGCP